MYKHCFEKLPDRAVQEIFKNISFAETAKFRLIDKWFDKACTKILNATFLSLKSSLDVLIAASRDEINDLNTSKEESQNKSETISYICFRQKIYQILKSEITILYAVCGRYVQLGICCFTGGKILDYYNEILGVRPGSILNFQKPLNVRSTIVTRLFLLDQQFLDYFEEIIEPNLLRVNSSYMCYGTKVVDLLDCYFYSNYHLRVTYDGATCSISGCYEILDTQSASAPSKLKETHDPNLNQVYMLILMKYFRDQVRWNNFFYCVDSTCTCFANKKTNRRCSKFCLNTNEEAVVYDNLREFTSKGFKSIFDKTFSRHISNPSPARNIYYTVELQCSKYCAPMRLAPYILEASKSKEGNSSKTSDSHHSLLEIVQKIIKSYRFKMQLKVVLPSPDDMDIPVADSLELLHDDVDCVISQKCKELPV